MPDTHRPAASSDPAKALAQFWRSNYRTEGNETNPLIQRFVSNRAQALFHEHQARGNYFTYRMSIPILGLDASAIFPKGEVMLPPSYVDFSYMWSQAGTPESALKAIREAATEELLAPYPPDLFTEVREVAAKKKFKRARSEDFDVLGVEGAQGGIGFVMLAHLNEGDEVIITDPGYMHFAPGPKVAGAVVSSLEMRPENGFRIDPDELKAKITNRTKMLVLCDPLNPFGTVNTEEELIEIAEICRRNKVLIFNNITHGTHRTDPNAIHHPLASLSDKTNTDHVVSVTGISKGYALAGLRVGFLAGHPDVIRGEALLRMEVTKMHINPLSQYGALAALNDTDYVEEATGYCRRNIALIKEAVAASDGVTMPVDPQYGFCTMLDVKETGVTAQELTVALFKLGFGVIPGDACGDSGASSYIRINYSQKNPDGPQRFAEALPEAIKDAQSGKYAQGVIDFFRVANTPRGQRIIAEIEERRQKRAGK